MKRLFVFVFCLTLIGIALNVGAKVFFQDNFSKDAELWDIGPNWIIKDGTLRHVVEEPWVFATPKKWDKDNINYTIELQAKKVGGAEGFGLFFGITQDNPLKAGGDRNTLYQWVIGGWGNTRAQLARFVKGVRTDLVEIQKGAVLDIDKWHKIGIEIWKERVKCYFDDEIVADVSQDPATIGGLFAVGAWGLAEFDNVIAYFGHYGKPMPVNSLGRTAVTWGMLKSIE